MKAVPIKETDSKMGFDMPETYWGGHHEAGAGRESLVALMPR
jgi:hypothetical protein